MNTVLVTGGAGFIGSHLVEALLQRGERVVVLDCFDEFYDPRLKRDNVRGWSSEARLVEGDIRDTRLVDRLFAEERPQAVIHLAARAGVRPSIEQPGLYVSVNLDGTTALLEASRCHEVPRFVFGSSSSVYGNNEKVPFAEDDPVDHPISPYAATKKAGELLCHTYHRLFGLSVSCLRFFTVYGPRQRPEMAIHKFTRALAAGRSVPMFGDGTSARDYTYVEDIVDGVLRAYDRCAGYRIYNLGGSQTVTLAELIKQIGKRLGVDPSVDRLPDQPGDVRQTWADVELARRALDWAPQVPLGAGLDRFVAWFQQAPEIWHEVKES